MGAKAKQRLPTYSAYARGLENLLGVYNVLDIVPKERDEADLPHGMVNWVQRHDQYESKTNP